MKRVTFDEDQPIGARPAAFARSPLLCAADGCGWIGTAGDPGRFLCIAHHGLDVGRWPVVTAKTAELQWFADFIGEVQRMGSATRKDDQAWQGYAAQFWALSDATMAPTAREARQPGLYVYRMLGSLRAMAHSKPMPPPHVPLGPLTAKAKAATDD